MPVFKHVSKEITKRLLDFVSTKNIGKTITLDGQDYTFNHLSFSKNALFKSRGISFYFKTGKSIIRISDHWTQSKHFPKSNKLNCGSISGKFWTIDNKKDAELYFSKYAGKYPFRILAGKCGLSSLNKSCDHWKEDRND